MKRAMRAKMRGLARCHAVSVERCNGEAGLCHEVQRLRASLKKRAVRMRVERLARTSVYCGANQAEMAAPMVVPSKKSVPKNFRKTRLAGHDCLRVST